jgi:surfeit locus 1 family protein
LPSCAAWASGKLKRLAWKEDLLARIEVLKTAPAQPLGDRTGSAREG